MGSKNRVIRGWKRGLLAAILVIGLSLGGLFAGTSIWPSLGSQGAQVLRQIFGNPFVAELEMFVFGVQDTVKSWEYDLGLAEPAAPWVAPEGDAAPFIQTPTPSRVRTSSTAIVKPLESENTPTPSTPTFTPTPEVLAWPPKPMTPLGTIDGEGVWSAYIDDVAYRAFLQPDPERPYSVVAVIAIDLTRVQLHYVLGSIEPKFADETVQAERSGRIPDEDRIPGNLLAAFNGGFQAQHGNFGAMSGGVVAIPLQEGLGMVAIREDGAVFMGEWGVDITAADDLIAWRQNGPLVVQAGALTPHVFSFSPKDWGYTINDVSPTWRSGLALNAARQILFYVAGPSLTVEALGKSMLAAGANFGMQLDINPYWVHFTPFVVEDGILVPDPLFPDSMNENIDRYLNTYSHDYFYITVKE
ncbi:MAG: hypothetical protein HN413_16925 [Chloroflexi bacterium]|mgnify:CR=1 FL=1|jgi:hypothetical protein|nr:hypothetical protein [Chloroflexota bacterium]